MIIKSLLICRLWSSLSILVAVTTFEITGFAQTNSKIEQPVKAAGSVGIQSMIDSQPKVQLLLNSLLEATDEIAKKAIIFRTNRYSKKIESFYFLNGTIIYPQELSLFPNSVNVNLHFEFWKKRFEELGFSPVVTSHLLNRLRANSFVGPHPNGNVFLSIDPGGRNQKFYTHDIAILAELLGGLPNDIDFIRRYAQNSDGTPLNHETQLLVYHELVLKNLFSFRELLARALLEIHLRDYDLSQLHAEDRLSRAIKIYKQLFERINFTTAPQEFDDSLTNGFSIDADYIQGQIFSWDIFIQKGMAILLKSNLRELYKTSIDRNSLSDHPNFAEEALKLLRIYRETEVNDPFRIIDALATILINEATQALKYLMEDDLDQRTYAHRLALAVAASTTGEPLVQMGTPIYETSGLQMGSDEFNPKVPTVPEQLPHWLQHGSNPLLTTPGGQHYNNCADILNPKSLEPVK